MLPDDCEILQIKGYIQQTAYDNQIARGSAIESCLNVWNVCELVERYFSTCTYELQVALWSRLTNHISLPK